MSSFQGRVEGDEDELQKQEGVEVGGGSPLTPDVQFLPVRGHVRREETLECF